MKNAQWDMRDNDGRKLDHKTLEALRLRAVDQVQQGRAPGGGGLALGLHRKTVYGWLARYREAGGVGCWPGRCRGGRCGWRRCRCAGCGP
jgi:Helix-turn-helix domain